MHVLTSRRLWEHDSTLRISREKVTCPIKLQMLRSVEVYRIAMLHHSLTGSGIGSSSGLRYRQCIATGTYRTMVLVAQCTGLRAEEVLALEWEDIEFENLSMKVVRAVVHGRVKTVKTDYSEDELPLDPGFAEVLLTWKRRLGAEREVQNGISTPLVGLDLVFPSTSTGSLPRGPSPARLHPSRWLLPCGMSEVRCRGGRLVPSGRQDAERKATLLHDERRDASGKKYGSVGWHTFRHTYRSWLDSTSAPIGVQQKLMRHA